MEAARDPRRWMWADARKQLKFVWLESVDDALLGAMGAMGVQAERQRRVAR